LKTFMLLVALASKWPADRTPDLQRVTVVSTREECETIGKKLVSEAEVKWRSRYECIKGEFELGPVTEGWRAGGHLLSEVKQ